MTSQFSQKVSQILAFSREEAIRLSSRNVSPEHLLLGLLRDKTGPVHELFILLDINCQTVKAELEKKVRCDDITIPFNLHNLTLDESASNILKLAVLEARIQATNTVDEQHLLLAILHDHVDNGAKEILEGNNMNYEDAYRFFNKKEHHGNSNSLSMPEKEDEDEDDGLMSINGDNSQKSKQQTTATTTQRREGKTPVLDNFSTDLTKAAAEGKLDPIVGREREIQRVTEILCRRKKNNPILIGEPGVGKSAIVEGLAQLINRRHTSTVLFNKRIVNRDMAQFYVQFDKAFLGLYPHFVEDFSKLLQPDYKVALNKDGSMTTELRIFAFIRLGVTESSEIATLLSYSPHTIYNHRSAMKSKAIDKEHFEENVKKL